MSTDTAPRPENTKTADASGEVPAPRPATTSAPVIAAAPKKVAAKRPARTRSAVARPAAKTPPLMIPLEPEVGRREKKAAARQAEDARQAKPGKKNKAGKGEARKPKRVRDSFSFPESDYVLIIELKQRALKIGRETKKSEILRAGLAALAAMSAAQFAKAIDRIA